jgi:hypothetical protein
MELKRITIALTLSLLIVTTAIAQQTMSTVNPNVPVAGQPVENSGPLFRSNFGAVQSDINVLFGRVGGVAISGTPSAGYVPVATSATAAIWGAPGTIGNVNSVWTNDGATAVRVFDRLFVGAAAIVNGGNQPESPQDWLNVAVGATQNSQMVALSTLGLTGAAFGSRASDWPSAGVASNSIGVAFYGFANNTNGTALHPAWAGYAECQRAASVNAVCLGLEIDPANYGTTVDITPSAMFPSAGATVALWNGCGGVNGGTAPCSAAFTTLSNTQKFRKGLVFGAASLDTSVGNGGNGVAAELGIGQEIRLLDTSGNLTAELYSTKPATQAFLTINVPTNGGILFSQNGSAQVSFENNLMFPNANNTYALGATSFAWSNVVSVAYQVGSTPGASCTLTTVSHLTVVNGIVTLCN